MSPWSAALLVFLMLGLAGWSAWRTFAATHDVAWLSLQRRVGGHLGGGDGLGMSRSDISGPRWLGPVGPFLWDLAARAGLDEDVNQIAITVVMLAVVGAVGLGVVFGWHAAPMGVLFGAVPVVYLRRQGLRRARLVSEQLPDALDYVAHALRAGHGFSHAIQQAAEEVPSPVAEELRVVADSTRVGLPMSDGFVRMLARNPGNMEMRMFVSAAELHRKTGGNLAAILEQMAETIRERLVFEARVVALTTEVRTSSRILGTLPVLVVGALFLVAPAYLGVLFLDPWGRGILVVCVAMTLLAFLIMSRMSRIEVDA